MSPVVRRLLLALLWVLLVGGLLLAGGGHAGLHGDHDGAGCDACTLVITPAPAAMELCGLARIERLLEVPRARTVERVEPRLEHSPRGPPSAA
ncbi:MAG: hypothetical protein HZA53_04760 [Planctomycetes bacterium]|nr:hypothetical protein [Planctomycetota bacterium]